LLASVLFPCAVMMKSVSHGEREGKRMPHARREARAEPQQH
jgi:hypothetical protein